MEKKEKISQIGEAERLFKISYTKVNSIDKHSYLSREEETEQSRKIAVEMVKQIQIYELSKEHPSIIMCVWWDEVIEHINTLENPFKLKQEPTK